MGKPILIKQEHILDEKMKVLQSVMPVKDENVVIGQYDGYTDDPAVPDNSNTHTFATVVPRIHNERWEDSNFCQADPIFARLGMEEKNFEPGHVNCGNELLLFSDKI